MDKQLKQSLQQLKKSLIDKPLTQPCSSGSGSFKNRPDRIEPGIEHQQLQTETMTNLVRQGLSGRNSYGD